MLTKEILLSRIKEIVDRAMAYGVDTADTLDIDADDIELEKFTNKIFSLFIEFAEELIGENEKYEEPFDKSIGQINYRNELRLELRHKLEELKK